LFENSLSPNGGRLFIYWLLQSAHKQPVCLHGFLLHLAVILRMLRRLRLCTTGLAGDLNGDGVVDMVDFAIFANNWLKECGSCE